MSRSRRAAGPTISLFPFLAVLLCTMGALLVVLVLFSRSAKQGATVEQARAREQAEDDLKLARDNLAWRLEQVRGIRDRTAEDLAKARMQLAGIEDHARTLTDELATLERMARALESDTPRTADEQEIAALESRLKSARESLDEKRKELQSKPPAYAVVPYVGAAGTHRRPLYIECCIDGVFLQPEGIRLSPGDFEGPPGPGNPLASALRAAREHIAKSSAAAGDPAAQPYPLLLVRPSGVMAYYASREAIQSWGSEFGYQLIDEDWTLTFPPRDPALADVERRAVEESRERLAWLAKTRPAKPSRPAQQYRAATTRGGVVASGGPSVLGDQSRFDWSNQQKARGFTAGDHDGGAAGPFGGTGSAAGTAGGTGTVAGVGVGSSGGGAAGTGSGGAGPGEPVAGGAGTEARPGGIGAGPGGEGLGPALPGELAEQGGGGAAGGRYQGGSAFGGGASGDSSATAGGGARGGDEAGGGSGGTSQVANTGGSAAGGQAGGQAGGSVDAAGSGQKGGGSSGGGAGPAMPGMLQAGGGTSSSGESMAASRGKNWASLATADRPVPLTRPIHVECALDELRLLDDSARRVETRIPLGANTADSIDLFVKAVHDRVGKWGIAGERMYWKPELILSETADGRSRREELERLLADSGLDTRRTGDLDTIRNLPPVERSSAMLTKP